MLAVVASGVLVGAVGCGGGLSATAGPEPSAIVSRSSDAGAQGPSPSAATTSASRTASSAAPSPSLDPNSDAAILAAVHQYVAAVQLASRHASSAPIEAITASSCACRLGLEQTIDNLRSRGLTLTVHYEVRSATITAARQGAARVLTVIHAEPYSAVDSSGRLVVNYPRVNVRQVVNLQLFGQKWLVNDVSTT